MSLIIIWVVTGVKTTGVTSGTFKDCSTISVAAVQGLCGDAQTLFLFSLLTAGIRESAISVYGIQRLGVYVMSD